MKIRKKTSEPRDTSLTIRLSKSEAIALKVLAHSYGMSVGNYLINLALKGSIDVSEKIHTAP